MKSDVSIFILWWCLCNVRFCDTDDVDDDVVIRIDICYVLCYCSDAWYHYYVLVFWYCCYRHVFWCYDILDTFCYSDVCWYILSSIDDIAIHSMMYCCSCWLSDCLISVVIMILYITPIVWYCSCVFDVLLWFRWNMLWLLDVWCYRSLPLLYVRYRLPAFVRCHCVAALSPVLRCYAVTCYVCFLPPVRVLGCRCLIRVRCRCARRFYCRSVNCLRYCYRYSLFLFVGATLFGMITFCLVRCRTYYIFLPYYSLFGYVLVSSFYAVPRCAGVVAGTAAFALLYRWCVTVPFCHCRFIHYVAFFCYWCVRSFWFMPFCAVVAVDYRCCLRYTVAFVTLWVVACCVRYVIRLPFCCCSVAVLPAALTLYVDGHCLLVLCLALPFYTFAVGCCSVVYLLLLHGVCRCSGAVAVLRCMECRVCWLRYLDVMPVPIFCDCLFVRCYRIFLVIVVRRYVLYVMNFLGTVRFCVRYVAVVLLLFCSALLPATMCLRCCTLLLRYRLYAPALRSFTVACRYLCSCLPFVPVYCCVAIRVLPLPLRLNVCAVVLRACRWLLITTVTGCLPCPFCCCACARCLAGERCRCSCAMVLFCSR